MPGPATPPGPQPRPLSPGENITTPPAGYHGEYDAHGIPWYVPNGWTPNQNPDSPFVPATPTTPTTNPQQPALPAIPANAGPDITPDGYHIVKDAIGNFWYIPNGSTIDQYPEIPSATHPHAPSPRGDEPNAPTINPPSGVLEPPTTPTAGTRPAPGMKDAARNYWAWSRYEPAFQVRVWSRDTGKEWLNIGPHVTSISTSAVVNDPGLTFSFGLIPERFIDNKPVTGTWAQVLKPMDYVEIVLARRAFPVKNDPIAIRNAMGGERPDLDVPYVVTRGFVTNVREVNAVDGTTGEPQRRVMINGMNFGKLWTMYKMFILEELQKAGGSAGLIAKYKSLFTQTMTPEELMNILFLYVFKPQWEPMIRRMSGGCPQIANLLVECSVPSTPYSILPNDPTLTANIGSLDGLLRQYAAKPYMELFTYDQPWPTAAGGKAVTTWRWAPLTNRANRFPLPDHVPPNVTVRVMHIQDIQEHDIGTSDSDVYSYYWAGASQSLGMVMAGAKQIAPGYFDVGAYERYGFRPIEPGFPLYTARTIQQPEVATHPDVWRDKVKNLTFWLASVFELNPDSFEGQLVCSGRPDIKVGEYLDIPETGRRYYVEGVNHSFVPFGSFTTTLTITRGMPFGDLPQWVLPPGYRFDPNDPNAPSGVGKPSGPPQDRSDKKQ